MYQWEKSIGTYIISIQLCNQNWSDYHIQPAVPGKSKNKLLAIKVDENLLANLKSMDGWQDKVRAKLEELLQQEQAIATPTQSETYPTDPPRLLLDRQDASALLILPVV